MVGTKKDDLIDLIRQVLSAPDIDGCKQLFEIDPDDIHEVELPATRNSDLSNKQIVGMQLMLYGNLSQAEIARLLDLHRSTITKWKNENRTFQQAYYSMKIAKEVDESAFSMGGVV